MQFLDEQTAQQVNVEKIPADLPTEKHPRLRDREPRVHVPMLDLH